VTPDIATFGKCLANGFPVAAVAGRADLLDRFVSGGVYFARLLGISRQHLHDILEENKPLSPAVAVRVAKLFGGGAGIRVRMQASYDTWHAEWEVDVSKIKTLEPA